MTAIILTAIAMLVMALYLTAYCLNSGIPTSISATYYHTERKWLFPAVVGVCTALCVYPLFEATPEDWQFLAFLILGSLMFIAASPAFKEELTKGVHFGAAITCGVATTAWVSLIAGVPWLGIAGAVGAIADRKRWTFWLEIGLLLNLFLVLLLNLAPQWK